MKMCFVEQGHLLQLWSCCEIQITCYDDDLHYELKLRTRKSIPVTTGQCESSIIYQDELWLYNFLRTGENLKLTVTVNVESDPNDIVRVRIGPLLNAF